MKSEELLPAVLALSPELKSREKANQTAVIVPVALWVEIAAKLSAADLFGFDMLLDHSAIDWMSEGRIELVYQLYSTDRNHSLMVSVYVPRLEPVAPSVSQLWPIAEWQEREVFDLFGVRYQGHPDLRRLFLEDDWKGFPLLKDYQDDFVVRRPW